MKLIVVFLFLPILSIAQTKSWEREPNQAPKEPPYVTEEEWEKENPDAQPVVKQEQSNLNSDEIQYEVIEETDKYYKVRHPQAAKGLIRIKADGTYIYERDKSEITRFSGFRFGSQKFNNLVNKQSSKTFEDIYASSFSLYIDYEKPFWGWANNLKWNYGFNFIFSEGNGYLASGGESIEKYSLLMLPVQTGFTYHMQYWGDDQWIVPYVGAGVDVFFLYELRDDGEAVRTYTFGGHANAGVRFLIDKWVDSLDDLDEDYGINHVWLSLDFKKIIGGEPDLIDVSSDVATLGFGLSL